MNDVIQVREIDNHLVVDLILGIIFRTNKLLEVELFNTIAYELFRSAGDFFVEFLLDVFISSQKENGIGQSSRRRVESSQ